MMISSMFSDMTVLTTAVTCFFTGMAVAIAYANSKRDNRYRQERAPVVSITRGSVTSRSSITRTSMTDVPGNLDDSNNAVSSEETGKPLSKKHRNQSMNLLIGQSDNDWSVQDAKRFDQLILEQSLSLEESLRLLRRTRAVTIIANRLMMAEDEKHCFEEVSKLLVALFKVERSSYALMVDADHFTMIKCAVLKEEYTRELTFEFIDTGMNMPIAGTAVGACAASLEIVYTPDATKSKYRDHQKICKMGLRSLINVPILVNGKKFAGTLNIGAAEVGAFSEHDLILSKDIASALGAHVYSKRLHEAERDAHQVSKDLLHAMIHPKVLSQIEGYWHDKLEASKNHPAPQPPLPASDQNQQQQQQQNDGEESRYNQIKQRLQRLQNINREDSDDKGALRALLEGPAEKSEEAAAKALYAEDKGNITIIFTDIVGFSRIGMTVPAIKIMDMLQDLFHRFDELCENHGILKLETVGDAYVAAGGIFDDDNDADGGRSAAIRALAMAKDMIKQARKVKAPRASETQKVEYLQIRAGIHVGNITCGVLGQNLPRFSVFGNAINMAARMEQTSVAGKIHVSKDFHDLVGDAETEWEDTQLVSIKNMGEVETWILDPIYAKVARED